MNVGGTAGAIRSPATEHQGRIVMLYWTAVLFVIAIVAAVLGFGGIAGTAAGIAKILFFAFLILALFSLVLGRRVPT
jgi:uncharacterized membrane protein YtjA (UPF0391 family)